MDIEIQQIKTGNREKAFQKDTADRGYGGWERLMSDNERIENTDVAFKFCFDHNDRSKEEQFAWAKVSVDGERARVARISWWNEEQEGGGYQIVAVSIDVKSTKKTRRTIFEQIDALTHSENEV